MLANPEQYDDAGGRFTFLLTVQAHGFTAAILKKDGTWDMFAGSSSLSTFCRVMETIANAKIAEGQPGVMFVAESAAVAEHVRVEAPPASREEAAEFFARHGNVGRAGDLLAKPPTLDQLNAACGRAILNGQPQAVVDAARLWFS